MRKYFLIIAILSSFQPLFSQWIEEKSVRREIDSLKKILPTLRGSDKVDCLNTLAYKYYDLGLDDKQTLDSSAPYSNQAFTEAKKIGYKKGLGFSYLRLAYLEDLRTDINYNEHDKYDKALLDGHEKYLRLAISIGEEINDNIILGNAYKKLYFLTYLREKVDSVQLENYLKKTIAYLEQAGKQQGKYREYNYADCPGCAGNEYWLGDVYRNIGVRYRNINQAATALKYMTNAIQYFKKTTDKNRLGDAYLELSRIAIRNFDFKTAENLTKTTISIFHEAGNEERELEANLALCVMYEIQGDFENGVEYCKKGILLSEKLIQNKPPGSKNKWAWGQAFLWMGRLYRIAGDYESALDILRRAYNYYPGDTASNAFWTTEIGDVHRLMGNYDSALYYLSPFATSSQLPNLYGKMHLGYLFINMKEYDKALELITPFILNLRKLNRITVPLTNGLVISASAFLGKKNYQAALQNAREALANMRLLNGRVLMISDYKLLSEIFRGMGNNDSAYFYLNQHTILKDSLLNRQFYFRLTSYKKETEEAKKEARFGFLDRDNKIKGQQLKQEAQLKNFLLLGLLGLLILGFFVFRWLSLKRKNEKLRSIQLENNLKVQQLQSEKKETAFQIKTAELEMQALRAQMNPHFIFNCLSSINRFILKNESKIASNYLTRFSRLMRMVLMNSQKPLIALDDELQMLEIYLEMERLRFKNSFDYSITYLNVVDSDNVFIPPLLLQPFCENAIWHGLMQKEGQGRLDIELSMQDNILNFTITDNGVGRKKAAESKSKTAEKEKSMGLKITTERLALLNREKNLHTFYKIEDLEDLNGNAAGTRVTLKISFKESVEEPV